MPREEEGLAIRGDVRWRTGALSVVLLSLALRLVNLAGPSLRGDEAFTVTFSRQPLPDVWRTLLLTEPHPPLYYTIMHAWMSAAGQSELGVRFVSVLFGVLLTALTYRLGRALLGDEAAAPRDEPSGQALIAALLVAVNPYLVWQSQDARMYTLLAAACAAQLLLATVIWQRQETRRSRGFHLWVGYVAVSLIALYSHYGAVFALLAVNLAWLLGLGRSQSLTPAVWKHPAVRSWLVAQVVVVLCYLPWMLAAAPMLLGHTKGWIAPVGLGTLLERSLITYSLGTTSGAAAPSLAAGFLAVAAVGVWQGVRASAGRAVTVLAYLLAPLLIGFGISLRRPMFDERYFLFIIPAYAVLLGWGLGSLARDAAHGGRPARTGLTLAVLAGSLWILGASAYSLGNAYFAPEYAKSPGWRELVQYIISSASPGDVVIQNYPDPTLSYYLDNRLPLQVIPSTGPLQPALADRQLENALATSRRIWFLPYDSPGWDEDSYVENWLKQRARAVSDETIGQIRLVCYDVQASPTGN